MKLIVVVALALVAAASAVPVGVEPVVVKIIRSAFEQSPEGAYNFDFESEDGVKREEIGELKSVLDEENKPHEVVVVRGSYSYPGEDGKPVVVSYYADDTGYHAEGDVIPKNTARR